MPLRLFVLWCSVFGGQNGPLSNSDHIELALVAQVSHAMVQRTAVSLPTIPCTAQTVLVVGRPGTNSGNARF